MLILFAIIFFQILFSVKSDKTIIQVEDKYLNYAKIKYEYHDDSQGFYINSILCNYENYTLQPTNECFGKVVLIDSADEINKAKLNNSEILSNFKAIIFNNDTKYVHYVFKQAIPIIEISDDTFNSIKIYSHTLENLSKKIDIFYTNIDENQMKKIMSIYLISTLVN
jgi:hypothetical protein